MEVQQPLFRICIITRGPIVREKDEEQVVEVGAGVLLEVSYMRRPRMRVRECHCAVVQRPA